ncbi:MAG: YcxB family protein [Bacteroidota bacterium]
MESFEIHVRMLAQDLLAFKYYMFYRRYWWFVVIGLLPLFEIGGFWLMGQDIQPILGHLALPVIFFLVLPMVMRISNQRYFNKVRAQLEQVNYRLSAEGVEIKAEGVEAKLAWHLIHSLRETRKYYFLFRTKASANVIPKRSFVNQAKERMFLQIMQRHLSDKQYKIK